MIYFGAHEWTIALPIPTSPLNRNRETSEFEGAITLPGACKILTRRLTTYPIHNTILISACGRRISQLRCWNSLHFLPLSGKILSLLISTRLRQRSHFAKLVEKHTIPHLQSLRSVCSFVERVRTITCDNGPDHQKSREARTAAR